MTITENKGQTLTELMEKLGPATKEEVSSYLEGALDEELVGDGRKVATHRISTDTARIYGNSLAFLERAAPEQKEHLPGLSLDLLRVAVWAAAEGERLAKERQSQAHKKSGDLSVLAEAAAKERSRVLARREILTESLRTLVGEDPLWLSRLSVAYGYCATADELTSAMTNLVALGRAILADPGPGLASRIAKHSLTPDWLDRSETMTASYAKAARAASGTASPTTVAQVEVDWWDGANLWLLEKVLNLLGAGNMADPSIPRPFPISLRTWFSSHRKAKPTTDDSGGTGGGTPPA